jgi:peptide-methionine (S)-S-oxide reductase
MLFVAERVFEMSSNVAYLGGGCFWCLEAIYQLVKGVEQVVSGYAGGGAEDNPTYHNHGAHAEVVAVKFDPAVVSYKTLLDIFWAIHNPTTLNRQGNDVGESYRSIILYTNEAQHKTAEASKQEAAALWDDPIVTFIQPLDAFHPAEDYHQNFYNNNPSNPYCQVVTNPKLAAFRKKFKHLLT